MDSVTRIVSEYRIGIVARRWGCRKSLNSLNSDPAAAEHISPYDFATTVQCSAPHHTIALSQTRMVQMPEVIEVLSEDEIDVYARTAVRKLTRTASTQGAKGICEAAHS